MRLRGEQSARSRLIDPKESVLETLAGWSSCRGLEELGARVGAAGEACVYDFFFASPIAHKNLIFFPSSVVRLIDGKTFRGANDGADG